MPPDPVPPFEPVSRAPLSLLVSRQLRDRIVSGALPLGTQLPSEKVLTEQFGVSRSTIREALRILQAQGLLSGGEQVTTSRPRVTDERTVESAALALGNVLRLGQVPLGQLLELRVLLERAALEQAAADPVPAGLLEARETMEAMAVAAAEGDADAFHRADVAFHIALVGAAGNAAFRLVLGVLREAIAGHLHAALGAIAEPGPVLARLEGEHRAILAAVERGDGAAAADHAAAHVLGFYAEHEAGEPA